VEVVNEQDHGDNQQQGLEQQKPQFHGHDSASDNLDIPVALFLEMYLKRCDVTYLAKPSRQ
jgi:hypothetical protein